MNKGFVILKEEKDYYFLSNHRVETVENNKVLDHLFLSKKESAEYVVKEIEKLKDSKWFYTLNSDNVFSIILIGDNKRIKKSVRYIISEVKA